MTHETTAQGTDYAVVRTFHNAPPLQTVPAPIFTIPSFIGGVALGAVSLALIVAVVLFVQAVISFEPPAASDANAPASSTHARSSVEATAAGYREAR